MREPGGTAGATGAAGRVVGGLLLFAGLSLMWWGAWTLFHGIALTPAATNCGALCSTFRWAAGLLGPVAAQVALGSAAFLAGLAVALTGRYLHGAR